MLQVCERVRGRDGIAAGKHLIEHLGNFHRIRCNALSKASNTATHHTCAAVRLSKTRTAAASTLNDGNRSAAVRLHEVVPASVVHRELDGFFGHYPNEIHLQPSVQALEAIPRDDLSRAVDGARIPRQSVTNML